MYINSNHVIMKITIYAALLNLTKLKFFKKWLYASLLVLYALFFTMPVSLVMCSFQHTLVTHLPSS